MFRSTIAVGTIALGLATVSASAGDFDNLPPFDFSDAFYIANGINPDSIIGRPVGDGNGSVMDNTPNGPDFNNVRITAHAAAYDHSGHRIFFYVTGLLTLDTFLDNEAGDEAFDIAETYDVYEFPQADAPLGSVFPKRQDLIADLRNGYFSNDPLGTWRIRIIKYTDAAFNTPEGQDALADLAEDNGLDLDGTPIIKTISEVESLKDAGFVSEFIPPMDGSQGLRWFFCPVIEDPRDGAIAPDAHLDVVANEDGQGFIDLFECLQNTGDENCDETDIDNNGIVDVLDLLELLSGWGPCEVLCPADVDDNGVVDVLDLLEVLSDWS